MSTNESTPDPTAGERPCPDCTPNSRCDAHWCCAACDGATPPADDASTPASEGPTKDEQWALRGLTLTVPDRDRLEGVVAQIKADARAKARAEALQEAIALLYTVDATENGIGAAQRDLRARIARGDA